MPRFFLHVREGDQVTEDPEGTDLPDLKAAHAEAALAACEIAADRLKAGKPPRAGDFEILDAAGRLLATVPIPPMPVPP